MLSLVENLFFQKNPLQDLLSSLNAVISTNESTQFITGHMVYNLANMTTTFIMITKIKKTATPQNTSQIKKLSHFNINKKIKIIIFFY